MTVDDESSAGCIRRAYHVLPDRGAFEAPETCVPRLPSQEEFLELVNDFWARAVWTTQKLEEGELWPAKFCCDWYMKRLLLSMLEWQARALHGDAYVIGAEGRSLERWADARTVRELRDAFAHYDAADVRRALWATMELFRRLALETSVALGLAYPQAADARITEWIRGRPPQRVEI